MVRFTAARLASAAIAIVCATVCLFLASGCAQAAWPAGPPMLRVVGTHILDSSGKPVILRGVNAASMEFTSDGEGHILTTVLTAITEWNANIVRLPLSEDRWFGHGPEQTDGGANYREIVRRIVQMGDADKCYILLDLHWSDEDQWGRNIGQHKLPDQHSVLFWQDVAKTYANNPAVLFDLYNEPHDVGWDTWLNGGTVEEKDRRAGTDITYTSPGMQALLDTIRSTGARNVVVCGGLNWAYDYSGILAGRQLKDPSGNGVVYSNHFYTIKGDTVGFWLAKMELASKTLPIIVSEWGSQWPAGSRFGHHTDPATEQLVDPWNAQVLADLTSHGWSWIAWDMHPSAGPCLISDWKYTPTPTFGAAVKAALTGAPMPPSAPAPFSAE